MRECHSLRMVALSGPGPDEEVILPAPAAPFRSPRSSPPDTQSSAMRGLIPEESLQEVCHLPQQLIRVQVSREAQRFLHALLPRSHHREIPAADGSPPGLLLSVYRHALVFHLLPRHTGLLHIELFGSLLSQPLHDRPLCRLLLVDAILQTEPQILIEFIRPPVSRVAVKKLPDPVDIQPFPDEPDYHIEIMIGCSVREKGHEWRLEVIVSRRVPDYITRPSGVGSELFLDHFPNTATLVRSSGILAAITSRMSFLS